MDLKIIQWNLNGFINNYHQLQLIIKDFNPDIISLQETHIPVHHNNIIFPKQYVGIFHNLAENKSAKQGIAMLIKKTITHNIVYKNNEIATIAIQIGTGMKMSVACIYIPPHQHFTERNLKTITENLSYPLLITGDFNSHSQIWGSLNSSSRGKTIENFILNEDFIILNNGSPTHFSTHNTFSHVDISLCSSQIAPLCSWKTLPNLYGSDHYPILITIEKNVDYTKTIFVPKFKTELANWPLFQENCKRNLEKTTMIQNINQQVAVFTKSLKSAANISIPQTRKKHKNSKIMWWNSNLDSLRNQKQKLWHFFKRNRNEFNLLQYKKQNALFRKAVRESKALCLQKFTSNINPNSSPKKIWCDIKILSGAKNSNLINSIKSGANLVTDSTEIANCFASHWSSQSDDTNFPPTFREAKGESAYLT